MIRGFSALIIPALIELFSKSVLLLFDEKHEKPTNKHEIRSFVLNDNAIKL